MPIFLRPVKTLGNREYALEKAANPNEPIKSAEVDGDFDTIYAGVNGNLDTTNLSPTAGILGTQISGIPIGSGVRGSVSAAVPTIGFFSTTETTIVTLPSLTTHGGVVVLFGLGLLQVTFNVATSGIVTIRLYRDASVIATFGHNVGGATTSVFPLQMPLWAETPSAAAHVYKVTAQSPSTNIPLTTFSNAGTYFGLEFA